ncbi:MAG: polyphenol oxidase family protein [Bacilli bacterium]|nr:polyphenol oxidase family protein [Bacilli bacterium]
MERKIKDFKYNKETLESLGVIPFTLRKDSLKDEYIISWTTSPRYYSEDMKSSKKRIDYVFGNAKKVGLDEMVMPDQPKGGEVCHEITYDDVWNSYKTDLAHKEGTIWNVEKKYDAVFMRRETHFRVSEDFGRSISLVFPAADCAIVRLYDKEKDVIGLTHSDIERTTRNIVGDMIQYMKEHFDSNPKDIMVFVGAFAKEGMIWDKYPPFAEKNKEEWDHYIEKIDDTHYNIRYGNKLYDQLIESGLSEENIYFDEDNTVKDENYFSNNRSKLLGEREGRNLFGITFDSLPVYESLEQEEVQTRLK